MNIILTLFLQLTALNENADPETSGSPRYMPCPVHMMAAFEYYRMMHTLMMVNHASDVHVLSEMDE